MQSFALAAALVVSAAAILEDYEDSVSLFEDYEDSVSLLQLRAELTADAPYKGSPYDPYWPNPPPAPDGKIDTEQTESLSGPWGPCVIGPKQANGRPAGYQGRGTRAEINAYQASAGACPNTVDNRVLRGDGAYKSVYPDWQCGYPAEIMMPHYGQTKNINKFGGYSFPIPGSPEVLPYTDHADNCIANCRSQFPDVTAVSVDWGNPLTRRPYGSDAHTANVPAKVRIPCYCHFNSTLRLDPDGCTKQSVWLGDPKTDADGCPCTNGISLTLKPPTYSNLGGTGPDMGSPPEILYPEAGVIDGQVVSVRVWTDDPSYKGNGAKNGLKGSLGRLSMKAGQENTFQLAVVDAKTKEPLKLGHALPMTFLDLDEGKKGKARATVSVCGAQQFVTSSSELTASSGGGCSSAASSARGNSEDNPSSVEGALSDDVASRRVASYIVDATDSGIYTFTLALAKGYGHRNFLFSLSPGAACSDDTRMPTGCAAALNSEGL